MIPTTPVKCLSVRQPFAWLLVNGFKDVEYRTWKTDYRGTIFIHASKTIDKEAYRDVWEHLTKVEGIEMPPLTEAETGGLVGCVELVDIVTGESAVNETKTAWELDPNTQNWIVTNPYTMDLYSTKGRVRLFTVELPSEMFGTE